MTREFEERIQIRIDRVKYHPDRKVRNKARTWLREHGLDHLIPDVEFSQMKPVGFSV